MRRRRIRLLHISRMVSGNLSDSTSEHHTPEHQSLHNAERTVVHDAIHNASNNTSRKHADCLELHTDNATSTQTSSIHASAQSSAPSLVNDGVISTSASTVSAGQSCVPEATSECAHITHHAAAQQAEQSDASHLAKTPEKGPKPAKICSSRIDTP